MSAPDAGFPALGHAPPPTRRTFLIVAAIAAALQVAGLSFYQPPLFYDDAVFFFRYAEHIAQGEGFRWNLGEPPIWGASAPLWPIMLAALMICGVGPEHAALALGWMLAPLGAAAVALAALRCAGLSAAAWCILFQAVNHRLSNSALSGMESPLAMVLVSGGLLALSREAARVRPVHDWLLGVFAGLAIAEKIDLAPFGVLLLAGAWIRSGRPPWRATFVAAIIAGAWYLFALMHFGTVLPNSFVTKLGQAETVSREWFFTISLLEGGRLITTAAALLAIPALWARKDLLLASVGLIAVMLAGYSIKPPAEDFGWYQAPLQPALCFLAGTGMGAAMHLLMRRALMPAVPRAGLQAAALTLVAFITLRADRWVAHLGYTVMDATNTDRLHAGQWIDAHTPKDARLLTGFGYIAYYARRYTYDFSFLNRRGPVLTHESLLAEHRPEVYADCLFRTGVSPERFTPPAGYRVAKIFDRTYRARVEDYYVVVMLRQDVPVRGG